MIETIYFDMDGVLADFEAKFKRVAFDPSEVKMNEVDGDRVSEWLEENAVLYDFFTDLPPMKDFASITRLMSYLSKDFRVKILTSCGDYDTNTIAEQKKTWLKNIGLGHYDFIGVRKSKLKSVFADETALLIDDRTESTIPFEDAGGSVVLYTSYSDCFDKLSNYVDLNGMSV